MGKRKKAQAFLEETAEVEETVLEEDAEPVTEEKQTFIKIDSGAAFEVVAEDAKYYICRGGVRFRKGNAHIEKVGDAV